MQAIDIPSGFENVELFDGIASPATFKFAPDGRLFFGERINGRLRVARFNAAAGTWQANNRPFYTFDVPKNGAGVPTAHRSSGLRDIEFDPDFASNGYVYVFYMNNDPRHNRVVRIRANPADPDVAVAGSEELLIELPFN
ncbi:MAG: PQQ-dependent sugar dehydrogenase, partial [Gammaproteobacteria bacterium]